MKIKFVTLKTVCIGVITLASYLNKINAKTSDADSIMSDSTLFRTTGRIVSYGGGDIKDTIWEEYVSNIKSGDTITDLYAINKITKDCNDLNLGYAGSWLKDVIVYTKDGVKYEIEDEGIGYLAIANLVSDSMKVWEVPDSFEYKGKKCYVPYINTRINTRPYNNLNGRNIDDENPSWYNVTLTKVVFPCYTQEISGFSDFVSLEEVVIKEPADDDIIKNDLDDIELYSNTFSNCPSLKKVVLSEGVTDIGDYCLNNCDNLTEVILPNSLEDISHHVLSQCDKLERIYIPFGVEYIGKEVLSNCPNLKEIIVDPKNPYYDSRENCNAIIDSKTGQLIIGCKGTVIPGSVTSIGENAFLGSGIETIVIPESVTEIGASAFSGCNKLRSVSLPSSITSINNNTFNCCFELSSITLPSNLKTIGQGAFAYCTSITSLTIPASVDSIGMNICYYCQNLRSIKVENKNPVYDSRNNCNAIIETATDRIVLGIANSSIPKTVKSIDRYAFKTSLIDDVYIPRNVIHIGNGAFSYCKSLTSITVDPRNPVYDSRDNCNAIIETATNTLITGCIRTDIPQSVTIIGKNAFHGCSTPVLLDLPAGIKKIDDCAFTDCYDLRFVILPPSLDYIGDYAFASCKLLNYLRINDIKSWGEVTFGYNNNLNDVVFDSPLKSIGRRAFDRCRSLKSLVLPEGLDTIMSNAFDECDKLEYVRFPSTLKYIGIGAFSDCTVLNSPILPEGLLDLYFGSFAGCHSITELNIPKSAESKRYNYGSDLRNLRVLKLPSPDALRNLRMPNCYNLEKIIIK
jgi:hypothetical protein